MKLLRAVLLFVLLILVVALAGGFVIASDTLNSPLPQTNGTLDVAGLQGEVEILRDDLGIPNLYGSSTHDLYFAQGYVQAQDRWWQMELFRHTGSGSLEELTGKNADVFGNDVFIRTVGWRRTAEAEAARLSPDDRAMLQAFADGVNAYTLSRAPEALAVEYRLLGLTGVSIPIAPWTPVDTLVWGKVMAWNLTDSYSYELVRQKLYNSVGAEMAADYTPPFPFGERPTILYPEDLPITADSLKPTPLNPLDGSADAATRASAKPADLLLAGNIQPATGFDPGIGSNDWVATGKLTQNGTPLLANDPHLGIMMPAIWYEIGLHCLPVTTACPLNVVGFALSPAPGVIVGHNDHIAWGVTNVGADVQDLYLITVNPDNPLQYRWNGAWRDMTVYDETIRFGNGTDPVTIQVRETHLGPIINDNQIDETTGEPLGFNNDDPMALRWTGSDPGTLFGSVRLLDSAANWEQFRAALSAWDVPSQNFVYADVNDNIGYQTPGRIPIRPAGYTGMLPTTATSDADIWQGFIPFDDLPRILNPARDYIVTANQAVVPPEYYDQLAAKLGSDANYLLSYDVAYGERAQRITELLKLYAPNSVGSYQYIQGDTKNLNAEGMLPYLADLQLNPGSLSQARDFLTTWDAKMDADSAQAALFAEFNLRLLANLFDDQLPDDIHADNHELWSALRLMADPENVWWDDATTPDVVETRDDILIRSLREALNATVAALGNNPAEWSWGKLHTATFVNNPLGASGISLLESLVNRGPYPVSGDSDSVNATGWSPASGNFDVRSLPSMRMIVDMANFENSLFITTTGESGHPSSAHYDDMIDSWVQVNARPMRWSRRAIEAAATDRLVLRPAG